jgi:hypothetical protein
MSTVGTLALLEELHFEGYFTTKTIFTPSLFKPFVCILSFLLSFFISAPALENGFTNLLQIFQKKFHLQVYIIASKHRNEVCRYNEGNAKDEASLSSGLEDTFGWRQKSSLPLHHLTRWRFVHL